MSRRHALVACSAVLLLAACGSRLPEQEILSKNLVSGTGAGSSLGAGTTTGSATGVGGTALGGGAIGGSSAGSGAAAAAGGSSTGSGAGVSGSGSAAGGAGGKAGSNTAPIVVGFIGALSGAGGVFVAPMRDAWLAWAKMVNAEGGINGHPVKVLVGDDGINDARGLAIARDFVENQHAIALSWSSNDITGIANYAKQKHVPVIGTQTSQAVWYTNPYLFPMGAGSAASGWAAGKVVADAGAKKVAVLYCVEAPASCKSAADQVVAQAGSAGVQVVYEAGVSITQPDYTAECLQARNAGAEATIVFVDENSIIRFSQSCHRQGYKPIIEGAGGDDMVSMPDMQGLIVGGPTFPWFLRSGSPGLVEYAQALQKYAPNLLSNGSSAQSSGWVSAKIFQTAAQQITANDAPSSQLVLDGLWGMKHDTLDGLAPGGVARTFTRLQPTPNVFCTFAARLENNKWVAQNGGNPTCR